MTMVRYKAIAAMGENRAIGFQGKLPWHLPEDLKFFKEKTLGQVIVMGRKTYESIGRPLPKRENVVLSRTMGAAEGVSVIRDLTEVEKLAGGKEVWVVGGAELYALAMPQCAELWLTRVFLSPEADAYFPPFEHCMELAEIVRETEQFRIERWVSKTAN